MNNFDNKDDDFEIRDDELDMNDTEINEDDYEDDVEEGSGNREDGTEMKAPAEKRGKTKKGHRGKRKTNTKTSASYAAVRKVKRGKCLNCPIIFPCATIVCTRLWILSASLTIRGCWGILIGIRKWINGTKGKDSRISVL